MPVMAQEQRGSIEGTVKDNTGAVLPGATVEAKSPALIGVRTTVSDSNGAYRFVSLPPGDYVISATLSGFQAAQSSTLTLTVGQNLKAELALGVGGLSEQVQVTADNTVLDLSSSQAATTISAKTIDQLPRGRTFNTLLEIAPGVRNESRSGTAGVGGYQVDGASTSENIFVVDGVDVSNLRNSSLGTQDAIPFEFLQELQIKTGGFEAQYGGALGGVINVVSKSGTDSFHGEGMYQFTGSALNSGLMYVPSQSSVIGIGPQGTWRVNPDNTGQAEFFQSPEDDYTKQYYGFTIGGPIVPNKLRFFAGYIPEQEKWDRSINFRSVGQRDSSEKILRHRGIGRADYSPSQKVQINASYFWNPQKTTGLLTGNDAKVSPPTTDLSVQGGYQPSNATNVGVNFIPTAKLLFSARYGYKYLNAKGNSYGKDQTAYYTYGRPSTFNGTVVPAQFAGPTGYANVASTLRTEKDLLTRHNLYLDATYFASIGGQNHTIKGGYALNRVADDVVTDYTNGNFTVYWGDVFTRPPVVTAPTRGTYGYYLWEDGVRLNSAVSSRNQGFYVQDTWQVTSRLTINAGLRIENEFLPPFRAEQDGQRIADPITFGWGDKIAPRIGGAYDVRGDGKWKLSASWSRINDVLKYELARGSFGGDYWVTHAYLLNDTDLTKLSKTTPGALGPEITNYDNRKVDVAPDGHLLGIDPDIKPMATDNVDVTSDYLVTPSTTFTVRYTHKSLVRAIEDIGILDEFGSEVYTIGNPGFGETSASNKTALGASLVPKAQRDYDAMEFRLAGRIPKIFYNVSYTYSRLYGNWSGLANSDEAGRSDPNVSRAFDLSPGNIDATGHNVYGRLATDRPHVLKLFGNYMLDSKIGTTSVGVQQTAFSGTPVSSTASFLVPVFYAGRGDLGRTAFYSQTNLMVTHGFRLKGSQRVVFEAYVDNLFDQKTEIYRNTNLLATGSGNNLNGYVDALFAGTVPPLASLINPPGSTAPARNAIYNMATQFQDGRQVRLGVRFQF